jgi:two-component system chemotaxis response regulator CheY
MGFSVHQAGTLEEARSLVTAKSPELVLMEWGLKGLSGEEVLRELQVSPTQVCVFTARPLETIIAELNRNGLKAIFRKSERLELLEHLEKFQVGKIEPPKVPTPTSAHPNSLEVLVIDDSSTVRLSLAVALQEKFPGCSVREADDGHAALAEMGHKKVDLLITDLEMPGMDGRDFLARIDSNPILRRKPIIIFSGHITTELHKIYGERTNIRFLQKPCSPAQVVETAVQLLPGVKTA